MQIINKNYREIIKIIVRFIKTYTDGKPVVIGLSGGIDSTLCAYLCYKALGKKKIRAIVAPSQYTPEADMKDVEKFAPKICGKIINISRDTLEKIRKDYGKALPGEGESERIIMDAYIRNNILRRYSRLYDVRVIGTINGTEWRIGYYPKYVLIGDLLPIADLYKTQIFEIAKIMGVPKEIIQKKPTLGLGCTPKAKEEKMSYIDEQLIKSKLQYLELDIILAGIENGLKDKEIIDYARRESRNISIKQIKVVRTLVEKYKHKRKLPPYPKINPRKI